AILGVLGIAAVGALLFDMLLLSRGLLVSFRALLDSAGFDVRVMAADMPVAARPRIAEAEPAMAAIRALPEGDEVVAVRFGGAALAGRRGGTAEVFLLGADAGGRRRPWVLLQGRDLDPPAAGDLPPVVVNRNLARMVGLALGSALTLRGDCAREATAAPPVRL